MEENTRTENSCGANASGALLVEYVEPTFAVDDLTGIRWQIWYNVITIQRMYVLVTFMARTITKSLYYIYCGFILVVKCVLYV